MNTEIIIKQLTQLEFKSDIPLYIIELLQSDYTLKPFIIEILPKLIILFHDAHICIPVLLEFLLDDDRKILYDFIINEEKIHRLLFDELINSEFYQHKLALCEILKKRGISIEEMHYVNKLIYDKIEIVSKNAVSLLDKRFQQSFIVEIIEKFFNSSYILQGSCPLLLVHLEDRSLLEGYIMKFIDCEVWMVRYNLCSIINVVDIDQKLFELCCVKFANDVVEEIRILFTETVCNIKCPRTQLFFIKKISMDTSVAVRLNLVEQINLLLQENEDCQKHKFFLFILQSMLTKEACDIQLLACEVICRFMTKTVHKKSSNLIDETIQTLEPDLNLQVMYNGPEDFEFLFKYFVKFSGNNKWRSRLRLLNMIIDYCTEDENYFYENLNTFLFLLLRDKVDEIRNCAAMAFIGLVNKFGNSFFMKNYEEIKILVTCSKYLIRMVTVDILTKILLLRNIEQDVKDTYIKPLIFMLENDSVDSLREYLKEMMKNTCN